MISNDNNKIINKYINTYIYIYRNKSSKYLKFSYLFLFFQQEKTWSRETSWEEGGWKLDTSPFPPPKREVTSRTRGREGGESAQGKSGSKKRHGFGIITATLFTYRLVYCRRGCWDSICVNSNKTCSHGSRIGNRHLPRVWNARTTYLQEAAMGGADPSSRCSSARQIKHPSLVRGLI